MNINTESIHAILNLALESPHGLTVEVESLEPIANRTKVAEQAFYTQTRLNAAWRTLYIGLSPDNPDTELWILHKNQLHPDLDLE